MILLAGDVLLYRPSSVFGKLIELKTWHAISHVEVYIGDAQSVASRDGLGTGTYPVRMDHLLTVCRPIRPFDLARARAWFGSRKHQRYGWLDLLYFYGVHVPHRVEPGIICSPFATKFLRAGGLDPFNGEPADEIAPFQFETSLAFQKLPFVPGMLYGAAPEKTT